MSPRDQLNVRDDCCKMATDAKENLEGVIMAVIAQYISKSS
jgi:hypothetical protein